MNIFLKYSELKIWMHFLNCPNYGKNRHTRKDVLKIGRKPKNNMAYSNQHFTNLIKFLTWKTTAKAP